MTTIALATKPNLLSQIKRRIYGIPHRRHAAKRIEAAQHNIVNHLTKPTNRLHTPLPIQVSTLWRIINNAIIAGQLDLTTLTDRPSELKQGLLYLSFERISGLLDDVSLPIADLTSLEFRTIMTLLGGVEAEIISEQSIDTKGQGEPRLAYRLPIATLINLNQPIVKAQLAEVA